MQMGNAAAANGVAIQYCMSHSRHMLASAEIPAVTQARASGDYHPGGDQWQQVGTTALFAHAIGIAPSKDNYWSTPLQLGSKWGPTTKEPYNRLQAAVITLTKGPVCPSDKVGKSDVPLIMRSAMSDGRLLQPGSPAKQIDAAFVAAAFPEFKGLPAQGEVWFGESMIDTRRYGVVFTARLRTSFDLVPALLGYGAGADLVAVETNATTTPQAFGASVPIGLKACEK